MSGLRHPFDIFLQFLLFFGQQAVQLPEICLACGRPERASDLLTFTSQNLWSLAVEVVVILTFKYLGEKDFPQ